MKKPITISIALVAVVAAGIGGYTIMGEDIGLEVTGPETAAVGELVEFNASGADSYSWVLLPASENQRVLGDTLYFSAQRPGLHTFVVSGTRDGKVQSKVLNLRISGDPKIIEDALTNDVKDWINDLDPRPVRHVIQNTLDSDPQSPEELLEVLTAENKRLGPEYRGFMVQLGAYMKMNLGGTNVEVHIQFLIKVEEALQ